MAFCPALFDFVSYKYQIRTFSIRMKMKLSIKAFSLLGITTLAVLLSCGSDGGSDAAPEKAQLAKLSKTWELEKVIFGGDDITNDAGDQIDDDFSITFSGTFTASQPDGPYEFSVEGTQSPSPLPPSGTWTFAGVEGNSGNIALVDANDPGELAVTYTIQSNGNLILTFLCDPCNFDGARASAVSSVNGTWEFTLTPSNN